MGKLVLYGVDASPPVRAVKLTLAALQLPYEYTVVNILNKEQYSEAYLKKNPQHTVPLLEDGEALIWDSHAIIAYLVGKYGKDDSLYPKDLLKRAVVDQRLHFEGGVVFANALRSITKYVLFLGKTEVPKERIEAITEAYDFVECFLKDNKYIAGDQLTIADFSLISSISSLVAYIPIEATKYPKLSAWIKRLEQLPYYAENAKGAGEFAAVIKSKKFTIVD
ncbi:glutathione S-transferase 1 [Drosophila virilis]|uniref:Glutathione transferase n=1 Tax=Drosophila virilis TaxID=7244 RepID=B4LNK0_DROVI|nr:glutathione S-transferase 1 [Drosophila virilis]XP_032292504.1 glutathione S-transferase 1-like [Drosophila virilis]EDW62180.1 uncharacterized protein Dvir_GJ19893 [Drosophila virilis]